MRNKILICSGIILIFSIVYFHKALFTSEVIHAGDYNFAAVFAQAKIKNQLFVRSWVPNNLLGATGDENLPVLSNLCIKFFPNPFGYHLNFIIPFFILLFGAYLLFRSFNFLSLPSVLGAVMTAFCPLFFSYILPGHVGKLYTLAFFPYSWAFINRALNETIPKRMAVFLCFSGFFLGYAFLHGEVQVALYFAALLSIWYFFNILTVAAQKKIISARFRILLFIIIPAAALLVSYKTITGLMGVSNVTLPFFAAVDEETVPLAAEITAESSAGGWEWATQWSMPPEETIDFIAPGIFGYFSGSPDAPYWGRTGRDSQWTKEKRIGMQNLSLTTGYLGMFLFLFMLAGIITWNKKYVLFFTAALIAALLLSYGKYLPFYRLFYALPLMDKFRNPNKFLHIVHFCAGILAAAGVQTLYHTLRTSMTAGQYQTVFFKQIRKLYSAFFLCIFITGIICIINIPGLEKSLYGIYPLQTLKQISENTVTSILRGYFVFILVSVLLLIGFSGRIHTRGRFAVYICILSIFLIYDQYSVNARYLMYTDASHVTSPDPIGTHLAEKHRSNPGRIKFITRGGYLNYFLNNRIPLDNLETVDIPAARSFAPDLETWMRKMDPNQLRYYSLMNVTSFLSDTPYNLWGLFPYTQLPDRFERGKSVFLYHNDQAMPRLHFVSYVKLETNIDKIFSLLNSSDFNYMNSALVSSHRDEYEVFPPYSSHAQSPDAYNRDLSENPDRNESGYAAENIRYTVRSISGNINADRPLLAVCTTHYNSRWKAYVNGKPVRLVRANYLFMGAVVPAGNHEVTFVYETKGVRIALSALFWAAVLLIAVYYLFFISRIWKADIRTA